MEEKFCKDCPCVVKSEPLETYTDYECALLPQRKRIPWPLRHYCYLGRQIMAEEESPIIRCNRCKQQVWKGSWKLVPIFCEDCYTKAKESFEVKSDE